MAKEYEPIVTGVAIILIIIFMPRGIVGVLEEWIKPRLLKIRTVGQFFAPKREGRPSS
jgi:hypothetical protein